MSVMHKISADGLTLTSERILANGTVLQVSASWPDLAVAQQSYEQARQAGVEALYRPKLTALEAGTRDSFSRHRFGPLRVILFSSVGGKPWRLPHPRFKVKDGWLQIGLGWLRAAGYVGFSFSRAPEA